MESRNEKSIFAHGKSSFCLHVVRAACATSLQFNSMLMDIRCLAALSLLCVRIRRAKLRLPDETLIARITKFCEI